MSKASRAKRQREAARLVAANASGARAWDVADPQPFVCTRGPRDPEAPSYVVRTVRAVRRRGGRNDGEIIAANVTFPSSWLEPAELTHYLERGDIEYAPCGAAQRRGKAA